jgi:hypothetical protein
MWTDFRGREPEIGPLLRNIGLLSFSQPERRETGAIQRPFS